MDNLWNKVYKTDPALIQEYEAADGTMLKTVPSIHRIEKATEHLGQYGSNWGLKDIKHSKFQIQQLVFAELEAVFYVKTLGIEFEISNSTAIVNRTEDGKLTLNSTYRKALETDTINKALSRLGFFADLYTDIDMANKTTEDDEILSVELVDLGAEDG